MLGILIKDNGGKYLIFLNKDFNKFFLNKLYLFINSKDLLLPYN